MTATIPTTLEELVADSFRDIPHKHGRITEVLSPYRQKIETVLSEYCIRERGWEEFRNELWGWLLQ